MYLSVAQALSVWSDLEAAFRGEHSYDDHVAEIYAYRLMQHSPVLAHSGAADRPEREAIMLHQAESLHELLTLFAFQRHAKISIQIWNGPTSSTFRDLGPWVREHPENHRWHVRVEPEGPNR